MGHDVGKANLLTVTSIPGNTGPAHIHDKKNTPSNWIEQCHGVRTIVSFHFPFHCPIQYSSPAIRDTPISYSEYNYVTIIRCKLNSVALLKFQLAIIAQIFFTNHIIKTVHPPPPLAALQT